jgi:hypothetical protein
VIGDAGQPEQLASDFGEIDGRSTHHELPFN